MPYYIPKRYETIYNIDLVASIILPFYVGTNLFLLNKYNLSKRQGDLLLLFFIYAIYIFNDFAIFNPFMGNRYTAYGS